MQPGTFMVPVLDQGGLSAGLSCLKQQFDILYEVTQNLARPGIEHGSALPIPGALSLGHPLAAHSCPEHSVAATRLVAS